MPPRRAAALVPLALGVLGACGEPPAPPAVEDEPIAAAPLLVGSPVCIDCHPQQASLWRGSHHDLAMQEVGEDTVLGAFDGRLHSQGDERTRFLRRAGRYLVEASGPDGAPRPYEVAYVFGVDPLQQLLLRAGSGRLQALGVAWDARPAERGGQRWLHLYPDDPPRPGDALHWAGVDQTWNHMCADCHSTRLEKRYDAATRTYSTRFAELDVGCEACHGPGSRHVEWARAPSPGSTGWGAPLGEPGEFRFLPGEAIARRVPRREQQREVERCAPCHSRRSALSDAHTPGVAFLDDYRPALLDPGLYFADGQIRGEVYVWGSFLQSRMYAEGVSCSDCHDPHSLALVDGPDATCGRCHRAEAFATPDHHRHPVDSAGASCVACHMPSRTYMRIDERHDHSFRVPRPDLAERTGATDACTACHADRDPPWAAAALEAWGVQRLGTPHYGLALAAGRERREGSDTELGRLLRDRSAPAIARATALRLLGELAGPSLAGAVGRGARDASPLVRMAAAEASRALEPRARLAQAVPLLGDARRVVRLEAALALSDLPGEALPPPAREALERGLAELRSSLRSHADRPEAQLGLGMLAARSGAIQAAALAYETALELDPGYAPAYANLADLLRQAGRDDEGEEILRRGLARATPTSALHHALGLLLVRRGDLAGAVVELGVAAEQAPDEPRFVLAHVLALHELGESERARELLDAALARRPADPSLQATRAALAGP